MNTLKIIYNLYTVVHVLQTEDVQVEVEHVSNNDTVSVCDSGVELSTVSTGSDTGSETDSGGGDSVTDSVTSPAKCLTLPSKLNIKQIEWDELDDLLQVTNTAPLGAMA